jgi:hypothetical protein
MILYNIARLYLILNKYDKSEKAYKEALKIRMEFVNRNPDAFKPDLATTLNGIGSLYRDLKKHD